MKFKDSTGITGKYRFIKTCSITGKKISETPWIDNLVVNGTGTGINILARLLSGDNTYSAEITAFSIGTGTTTPASSDTDLETLVFTKSVIADMEIIGSQIRFSFFLNTTELANGTYNECGLKAGTQLFSRSLILPAYEKGTNEDTTVEYVLTINN